MKEPQFFTLLEGRGSMRLVPYFRPKEWDESKDLFKKHRINNVYLEDLKDYTWFLD
jgi:hypothetical protein